MASYASVADLLDVLAPGVTAGELDNAWESEQGGIDRRLDAIARLGLGWSGALEWADLTGAASRRAIYTSGTAIAVAQAATDRDFGEVLNTIIPIAYTAPFVIGAGAALAPAAPAALPSIIEEISVFDSVSNWFGNALSSVGGWFGTGDTGAVDAGVDLGGFGDLAGIDLPDIAGVSDVLPDDWMRLTGIDGPVFGETGNIGLPAGMEPAGWPSAAIAAGRSLLGLGGTAATAGAAATVGAGARMATTMTLAGIFGAARAGAAFTLNGIRGTVPQLWKYTRKYGPTAVANALGISVGALGTMLLQNPERRTARRRGISSRDIRTTKRVVRFVSRMAHDIGCVRAPRHFSKRRH